MRDYVSIPIYSHSRIITDRYTSSTWVIRASVCATARQLPPPPNPTLAESQIAAERKSSLTHAINQLEAILLGQAFNRADEFRNQVGLLPCFRYRYSSTPNCSAICRNCSSATSRSAIISVAITSGSGRLALSSKLSSRSQKMSRLTLSRAINSS